MRTVDFSPFYRSAVGFDRLAGLLEAAAKTDSASGYPPYNIENVGDNAYRIEIAVAGFKSEELAIEVKENLLTVTGKEARQRRPEALSAPRPGRARFRSSLPVGGLCGGHRRQPSGWPAHHRAEARTAGKPQAPANLDQHRGRPRLHVDRRSGERGLKAARSPKEKGVASGRRPFFVMGQAVRSWARAPRHG